MRVVQTSRASEWLRRARDPDPQPLSRDVPQIPHPALPPECGEPACPDLFTLVNLREIDNNKFVHLLYRAFHLREPDQGGLNANVQALASHPSQERRESMARSFLASDEFRRANHSREAEAQRFAAFVLPEFRREVEEIFGDILPDLGNIRHIWDQVLFALFDETASFLRLCKTLGHSRINNGWIGKVERTELSGILPCYSIKGDTYFKIIFDGRADDMPLENVIRGSVDNGSGTELYLVNFDLNDHYVMGGTLHSVSIVLADGTLIFPSPMYVYATDTCEFNRSLDEMGGRSHEIFGSKPFRKSSFSLLS